MKKINLKTLSAENAFLGSEYIFNHFNVGGTTYLCFCRDFLVEIFYRKYLDHDNAQKRFVFESNEGQLKMTDSMWISTPARYRRRAFEIGYGN